MNIADVRRHVHKLYKTVYKTIKNEFLAILNPLYEEIYDEAVALGFSGDLRDLDEAWIEEFFLEYNPVTKYVFANEIGRKESRLFEALVANSLEKLSSYAYAERLMVTQAKQYAVDLEDAVVKTVYKDLGVQKVMWHAEHDHRTCGVCSEMDGEIYDLNDVPPKQHYQCRCWITPVKG